MKTSLIIAVSIAIAALVGDAVFYERWRIAYRTAKKRTGERDEAEEQLRRTRAMYEDVSGQRDRLAENADELRERSDKLARLAYRDIDTDLPNRAYLADAFSEAIGKLLPGEEIGLAMFEFRDERANIMSLLGRNQAEMRQEIVQRLRSAMNEEDDSLISLSDDAFAVLTRRIAHRRDYAGKIDKLFKLLLLPVMSNGTEVTPLVYGAVVISPEDGDTMQLLDMNLGIAMQEAVAAGESGYRFYTPEMAAEAMKRMSLQAMVTESVRTRRMEFRMTPRASVASGRAEWLVVTPSILTQEGRYEGDALLAGIDESGLAIVVYEAMLNRVCEDLRRYSEMGIRDVMCVIPVTDRMFLNREFIKTTYDVLQHLELDMRRVLFEVTEAAAERNVADAVERMRKLSNFGIRFVLKTSGMPGIAVDALCQMPLDAWFLQNPAIPGNCGEQEQNVLAALAQSAHAFGAALAISGVNTKETEAVAVSCGVDIVQGELYGGAMSEELAGKLLTALR
ncbi:MAG: EAL domain-containing protein [Lachnospiraceae bacterium]|nr:EAL domain-containing protein [Lachnospiraceae bacterium]